MRRRRRNAGAGAAGDVVAHIDRARIDLHDLISQEMLSSASFEAVTTAVDALAAELITIGDGHIAADSAAAVLRAAAEELDGAPKEQDLVAVLTRVGDRLAEVALERRTTPAPGDR